jgi:gluconokinase
MVIIVMGVSGSGKTTLGSALAARLDAHFLDADDVHPKANVEKMRSGVPLTDADREPWLRDLRLRIDAWLVQGTAAVLACSALTVRSREVLGTERPGIELVFLDAPKALIAQRMRNREHFMPESLAESQFAALEPPNGALTLDASAAPDALVERVLEALRKP